MRRYLYGWRMWLWAVRQSRAKRHGVGPMKWKYVFKNASCVRWLVDGQPNVNRAPRWLRAALDGERK